MAEETDPPTNCVILHHPDAVDTSRPKLMGRHAAGEGFLKGFVRHSGVDGFHAQCFSREHFEDFKKRVGALDPRRRPCHLVVPGHMGDETSTPRTLVLPGPGLSPFAWRRRRQDGDYSIVGLTHTTASETAMAAICDLSVAPTRPWDALVCTSNAVKGMVEKLLGGVACVPGRTSRHGARNGIGIAGHPLGRRLRRLRRRPERRSDASPPASSSRHRR